MLALRPRQEEGELRVRSLLLQHQLIDVILVYITAYIKTRVVLMEVIVTELE
jgi:hypothetical protein